MPADCPEAAVRSSERAMAGTMAAPDEARQIAVNIARLPELRECRQVEADAA
jgi:hypothetical protein